MNWQEALEILELNENDASEANIKEQFRWFVKFYHPDNKDTGNRQELEKIIVAYRKIREIL